MSDGQEIDILLHVGRQLAVFDLQFGKLVARIGRLLCIINPPALIHHRVPIPFRLDNTHLCIRALAESRLPALSGTCFHHHVWQDQE